MTNIQKIKDLLSERYEYLAKINALKYIKSIDSRFELADIVKAYNELYND